MRCVAVTQGGGEVAQSMTRPESGSAAAESDRKLGGVRFSRVHVCKPTSVRRVVQARAHREVLGRCHRVCRAQGPFGTREVTRSVPMSQVRCTRGYTECDVVVIRWPGGDIECDEVAKFSLGHDECVPVSQAVRKVAQYVRRDDVS